MRSSQRLGKPANKEGENGDILARKDTGGKTSLFSKENGIWSRVGVEILGSPSIGSFTFFKGSNKIGHDPRFSIAENEAKFQTNIKCTKDIIAKGPVSELVCIATDAGADAGIQLSNETDNTNWSIGSDGSDSHKFKIDKHWVLGSDTKLTIDNDGNLITAAELLIGTVNSGDGSSEDIMVIDSGDNTVKKRTYAQILSDLGITADEILDWTADQGSSNIHASNFADITSTGTLDISGGTLTTSAAQKKAIVEGVGANTDIGAYEFRAQTFESDVSTGTAPFTIASTTVVTNLNADKLDGADLVDEDNMASNSATKVPTQQSVKAYVDSEITGLVDSAPGALDTLNELAAALNDDASFSTTITNSLATKVGLTGDETVAGHKKFSDDVLIAGTASDPATTDHVSLGVSSGALRIHTDSGYVQIGPTNSGWGHFYTDRAKYFFNKKIVVDEGIVASYDEDLILRRDHDDTTYNQITIGDDSFELKLDNTVRLAIDGDGDITTGSWKGSVIGASYIATLNQDTTGNAGTFTVSANNTANETVYPVFVDGATGSQGAETDTQLNYNPSTGALTAGQFIGGITVGGHTFDDIDIGSEFVDTDDHVMSSGAIKEKIEDYGYTTNTGDVTLAGAQTFTGTKTFNKAFPQIEFTDDSKTDYVQMGLSGSDFTQKTSDTGINFTWNDNSNNRIMTLDTDAETLTIGESSQDTYRLKLGDNGRMNMPVGGLEMENDHGYFGSYGKMGLTHMLRTSHQDLIRHQTPLALERWNGSAWVDAISGTTSENSPTNNLTGLKNTLDGERNTAWQLDDEWRKFRFVIERESTWADDQCFYVDTTWSATSYSSGSSAGGSMCPTMTVEMLDGSFDASDDSANDWTTHTPFSTDWHTTGISNQWGLLMYYKNSGVHSNDTHVRITIEFPAWDASAGGNDRINIKNIGILNTYVSDRNTGPWTTDWDRNADGYGDVNIPSGHSYKVNASSVLSATTLGSGVVNSSLTSVGTLGSLAVTGDATFDTTTLKVDSSNNRVGIGTASPNADLQIHSASGTKLWITAGGSNPADAAAIRLSEQENGSSNYFEIDYNGSSNILAFHSNNQNDMFSMYRNGNTVYTGDATKFGVGTSSLQNKFQIYHTAADGDDGMMIVRDDTSTADTNLLGGIGFDSTDGNVPSSVLESSAFIAAYAAEDQGTGDKGADLVFGATLINDNDDTVSHEYMRILDSGNVGIGTTSPQTHLNVFHTSAPEIAITGDADNVGVLGFGDDANYKSGRIEYDHASNFFTMDVAGTEKFKLTSSTMTPGVDINLTSGHIYKINGTSVLSNNTLGSGVTASSLTSVGTISSGTWNGTAIASAYLDSDTAHLSGTQTFSGSKTFSSPVSLSNTSMFLRGEGGIFIENSATGNGGSILQPSHGMYRTSTNAHTGCIKIVVPRGTGANPTDMVSFWVDVFDYGTDKSFSAYISGYLYQDDGSDEWHNCGAMILGKLSSRDYAVRFCHDGSNHCVTIGEIDTTWAYMQVTVRNVQVGYSSDIDDYTGNWTITFETSLPSTVDTTISGNFPIASRTIGTADVATTVTLTDQDSDSTCFPLFSTANTGDRNLHTDNTNLTYDSTNGTLSSANLTTTGNLTIGGHSVDDIDIGSEFNDVDDHLMSSGAIKEKIEDYGYITSSGTAANSTHTYVAINNTANEENKITFVEDAAAGGAHRGLEVDTDLTYNPSTGVLTTVGLSATAAISTAVSGDAAINVVASGNGGDGAPNDSMIKIANPDTNWWLKVRGNTSTTSGYFQIIDNTTELLRIDREDDGGDVTVMKDLSVEGDNGITAGAPIWNSWEFAIFRAAGSGTASSANRYYRDTDDLDDYRAWDAYFNNSTGSYVISTANLPGHFVVPEACKILAIYGQIAGDGSTENPTVEVWKVSPSDATNGTPVIMATQTITISSADSNYAFNQTSSFSNNTLAAGDILIPTVMHGNAGAVQSYYGSLTVKFITT